jgi:hypothetical protein
MGELMAIPEGATIDSALRPGETIDPLDALDGGKEPIPSGATIDGLRPGETVDPLDALDRMDSKPESTITAPSVAGHMPGFSLDFGNKITPEHAAAGVAAGAAVGALPFAPGVGAGAVEMLDAASKAHPFIAHIVKEGIRAVGIGGGVEAVRKLFEAK